MFDKLFGRSRSASVAAPEKMRHGQRMRAVEGSSTAALAARLLIVPTALMQLSESQALTVVSYMIPREIPMGMTFIEQGEDRDTGYMALLLEGEVTVESLVVSRHTPATMSVLGPGGLVGELSLIDGQARLASCTATTDVLCAILSREALEKLASDHPQTGARLMFAISLRMAERVRDTSEKLKKYTQLVQAMQEEIDRPVQPLRQTREGPQAASR